jgi:predicted AAA+ superfamily ATPase
MIYLPRALERKFLHMNGFFKAILVTGARQVGKTTMLRHLAEEDRRAYVSLDDLAARALARSDPALFFQTWPPPVIIDEVQYAPELFGHIKILCDASDETGQIWLTGSQQFSMMKHVRETLAGRIGILTLHSLSQQEIGGVLFEDELDFCLPVLRERQGRALRMDVRQVFEMIWHGGMPQVLQADAEQRHEYYNSYVNTWLMRDIAELGGVTDTLSFSRFLVACAALTAEPVNYKKLAEATGISQPTAKTWLCLLEGLGVIYLLAPYANNALKRLAKTPKLYFCDSGLAAYLAGWLTPLTLMNGAASGHFFENYVVTELLKGYAYARSTAKLSYLREANALEIDLLVEENNCIHPLEIKKSANPDYREVKKFAVLDKAGATRDCGGIVCMSAEAIPLDKQNCLIPCFLL